MTIYDDKNFEYICSNFKSIAADIDEDTDEIWKIIDSHFKEVLSAEVEDNKKLEELDYILSKVESIDLFYDGLALRILEQKIKYIPKDDDIALNRLAQQISFHSNSGYHPAQMNNMNCLKLMNGIYMKMNNKENFRYKEHVSVYQNILEKQAQIQKYNNKKNEHKESYAESTKQLEEIDYKLKQNISADDKLKLIEKAISLSSVKAFGRVAANNKKASYCDVAVEICTYEYPRLQDEKIYYQNAKQQYLKNAKNAQKYSHANSKKMMFTKNTSQYF